MGVELGEGELVGGRVVHGEEKLAGLDDAGDEGADGDLAAAGTEVDSGAVGDFEAGGVGWIDLDVDGLRVEGAEDGGFGGAGLGVPLGGAAPAGQEREGEIGVGKLGGGARGVEEEAGAGVGGEKASVGEEAAVGVRGGGGKSGGPGPLDAAVFVEGAVVLDPGDVARLVL